VQTADILVIGGGVAGLSAAAALAPHARVILLEAEEAIGFHASGRSATMLHYALGNPLIRNLTRASRRFFEEPPPAFGPLATNVPVLVHARDVERAELDRLERELTPFGRHDRLDAAGIREACPLLKTGPGQAEHALFDPWALKLDSHALLQGFQRTVRAARGTTVAGARVTGIERAGGLWHVTTAADRFSAPVLVNAAGAWADEVARLAAVRPIGLGPLRRTIITLDAPPGTDLRRLPFTKTIHDELYFGPEAGQLFASPMDEVPSEPCDAQPDEYEVALAADRMEDRTQVEVKRVAHRWAGLRSFVADRSPVAGFATDAEGFFWLAGQGGSGLQTSPVLAEMAASIILGRSWPDCGVAPDEISPARLGQAA